LQYYQLLGKVWDVCILTSTDDSQKGVYQRQLERLIRAGFLHPETEYRVISDPQGQRIGSGGATLHVLREMEKEGQRAKGTWDSRILILHSGGDSRRIPHLSVLGKVFASLPEPLYSLFEGLYPWLTILGSFLEAGMIVASGDVLLSPLAPESLALPGGFDVVGVAAWGSPELGQGHGVYDADPQTKTVRRCLQKLSAERLRQEGVCNAAGRVAIDTGVLLFWPRAVERLWELARWIPSDAYVDLYGEMLPALAAQTEAPSFSRGDRKVSRLLWEELHSLAFGLWDPPGLEFIHTGTTREYLALWRKMQLPRSLVESQAEDLLQNNCSRFASIAGCDFRGTVEIAQNVVLWNIEVPESSTLRATTDTVHCQVPLDRGWVYLTYGVSDVPTACGEEATLFGTSLLGWIQQHGLPAEGIWPDVEPRQRCLWNAHLYPVDATPEATLSHSDWFHLPSPDWWNRERLSMADIMSRADRMKAFAQVQQREGEVVAREILRKIEGEEDVDVRPIFRRILTPFGQAAALRVWAEALPRLPNPLHRARLHKVAADLCALSSIPSQGKSSLEDLGDRTDFAQLGADHEAQAFEAVRWAVSQSLSASRQQGLAKSRFPSMDVADSLPAATLQLPVRVDLAGGWTDTPPYCLEKGGAVLNAAVLLKGQFPVKVMGRRLPDPVIRLKSLDQKRTVELEDYEALQDYSHLDDPLALHRAVLVASGILEEKGFSSVPGIELISSCEVPLGSGLGTSSILAAGMAMAVWRLMGLEWTDEQLFNQVLYVEQMLTAGGGWQDQVGAVIPGLKLTTTQPGIPQRFQVERLSLAPTTLQELSERLLLVYTGQQRVAKNILQVVVADWLSRRQDLVITLNRLREEAFAMRDALVEGDIEAFGHLLTSYWEGKKVLNAQTTNATIETILEQVADLCSGYGIAGAGGGGFLVLLARDMDRRREIEERLKPTTAVVYPWELA